MEQQETEKVEVTVPDPYYNITINKPLSEFRPPPGSQCAADILRITPGEAQAIEAVTQSQRNSSMWFLHRKGRITASLFKEVCASKMTKCGTIVNKIFRPSFISTAAVRYGVENEEAAKQIAFQTFQASHVNARMENCGLMVPPSYPYLGCSPDALLFCDCHPPAVLEVKCLYSLKAVEPACIVEEGQKLTDFCLDSFGNLKSTHKFCYQVQAQIHLNLVGCSCGYLYLFVDKGGLLLVISKDSDFMTQKEGKLRTFFEKIVLPRICSQY